MQNNKKAAAQTGAAKSNEQNQYSGNDAAAQRGRILLYLREHNSLSTFDARYQIDVMHPAARVMELRKQGFEIYTSWVREETPEGKSHRVGRYHLLAEPKKEALQ